jgi:hypothetical protein
MPQPVRCEIAEALGDHAHDRRRTVDGGNHEDVVPGPDPPVGAQVAIERPHLGGGAIPRRPALDGDLEALVERAGGEVVLVNVLAGRDRHRGKADDLAVAAHRLADGARADRDLVPGGDAGGERDPPGVGLDAGPGGEAQLGDHHVILGMQLQRTRHAVSPSSPAGRRRRIFARSR